MSVDAPLTRWARSRTRCEVKTVGMPKPRCLIAMSALVGCDTEFRRMATAPGSVTSMRLTVRLGGGCGTGISRRGRNRPSCPRLAWGDGKESPPPRLSGTDHRSWSVSWSRRWSRAWWTWWASPRRSGGCVHPQSVNLAGAWHRLGADSAQPIPLHSTVWIPSGAVVGSPLRESDLVVGSRCRWPGACHDAVGIGHLWPAPLAASPLHHGVAEAWAS
jgi:hypothetical protein